MASYYGKGNKDVLLEKGRIPYWVIADKLGIHEQTLIRWFRTELPPEKREKILAAIHDIKESGN